MKSRTTVFLVTLLAVGALAWAQTEPAPLPLVPYPEGFNEWKHLGSVVSEPNEKTKEKAPRGLIHHLYGNEKALEGLRTGKFPEGAILVADWFVLKEKYPGGLDEGARDRTDVMVRDARYKDTGGWGFDQFAGDSKTVRNVGPVAPNKCFDCHQRVKASDYVFSVSRP